MSEYLRTAAAIAILAASSPLVGCRKQLAAADFIRRYEEECAMTLERADYRIHLMYQSPEYLAALGAGPEAKPEELAALASSYAKAHYVRIAFRPAPGAASGGPAAAALGSDPLLPQVVLGERLKSAEGVLRKRIRLRTRDGRDVEPISAALQRGIKTGAGNAILAVFPLESQGKEVDLEDCELVIDDLGLNLGTLRNKLGIPKGFRLKVAA